MQTIFYLYFSLQYGYGMPQQQCSFGFCVPRSWGWGGVCVLYLYISMATYSLEPKSDWNQNLNFLKSTQLFCWKMKSLLDFCGPEICQPCTCVKNRQLAVWAEIQELVMNLTFQSEEDQARSFSRNGPVQLKLSVPFCACKKDVFTVWLEHLQDHCNFVIQLLLQVSQSPELISLLKYRNNILNFLISFAPARLQWT